MPVGVQHDQLTNSIYFITFTCYKWLPLIKKTNAYDAVYKWFDVLQAKGVSIAGYVIMPNHVHVLLHFPEMPKSLNTTIGNAKRFIAYEIIRRLAANGENDLLDALHSGVSKRERKKGQLHKVFEESFDGKECYSTDFIFQKLDYMHHNPVSGKWNLANDFTEYEHSSASFYENGTKKYRYIVHINDLLH